MSNVIVTGAAGGIGSAVCVALAAEGHQVIGADREPVAEQPPDNGPGSITAAAVDLLDADDCRRLVADAIAQHGPIDGAVMCAAIMTSFDPASQTPENFNAIMRVNVLAGYLIADATAAAIRDRGGQGSVVLFSSGAAGTAMGIPFYSASKGAVESITRELSHRWAPHGVRVNAVSPGMTDTPMLAEAKSDPERFATLLRGVGLRRPAQPSEIASVVSFLLSSASSFMTGQVVRVDGGRVSAL